MTYCSLCSLEIFCKSAMEPCDTTMTSTLKDGSLSISFIVPIQGIGKTQSEIEKVLEENYLRLLGVKTKITARLLEREPIYITV